MNKSIAKLKKAVQRLVAAEVNEARKHDFGTEERLRIELELKSARAAYRKAVADLSTVAVRVTAVVITDTEKRK